MSLYHNRGFSKHRRPMKSVSHANFPFVNCRCQLKLSMPYRKMAEQTAAFPTTWTILNGNDRLGKGNLRRLLRSDMLASFSPNKVIKEQFFQTKLKFLLMHLDVRFARSISRSRSGVIARIHGLVQKRQNLISVGAKLFVTIS